MINERQPSQQDKQIELTSRRELREVLRSAGAKHRRGPRNGSHTSTATTVTVTCHLCNYAFEQPLVRATGLVCCPACGVQFQIKPDQRADSIQIEQIEEELNRLRSEIEANFPQRRGNREKSVIGPLPMQTIKKSFERPENHTEIDSPRSRDFYSMVGRVRSTLVHLEKGQLEDYLKWRASLHHHKQKQGQADAIPQEYCDAHPIESACGDQSDHHTSIETPGKLFNQLDAEVLSKRTLAQASEVIDASERFERSGRRGDHVVPKAVNRCDAPIVLKAGSRRSFGDVFERSRSGRSKRRIKIAVAGILICLLCGTIFSLFELDKPIDRSQIAVRDKVDNTAFSEDDAGRPQKLVGNDSSLKLPPARVHAPVPVPDHATSSYTLTAPETEANRSETQNVPTHGQLPSLDPKVNLFPTSENRSTHAAFEFPAEQPTVQRPIDTGWHEGTHPRVESGGISHQVQNSSMTDQQLFETQTQLNQLTKKYELTRQNNEQLERAARQNEAESMLWEAYAHAEKDPVRSMILSLQAIEHFKELELEIPSNARWTLNQSLAAQNLGISLNGFQGGVDAMTLSQDGQWFLFAGDDGSVWLWDIAKHDQSSGSFRLDSIAGGVSQLLMTSNVDWGICVGQNGAIRIWNLRLPMPSEKPIDLVDSRCRFTGAVVSEDGRWMAASGKPGQHGQTSGANEVFLWDLNQVVRNGGPVAPIVLKGHEKPIRSLVISRNSKWLVSGSEDRTARVYDLQTPYPAAEQIVLKNHELAVNCVAVSPDGRWLVTGGRDSILRIWDLQNRQNMVAPMQLQEHEGWISALAFNQDGRFLATGSYDNTIRLWRISGAGQPEVMHVLTGHVGPIKSLEFSKQSNQLISLGFNSEAKLWNLEQGNPSENVLTFSSPQIPISSVTLSGDGKWLIMAQKKANATGGSGLRLWPLVFEEAFGRAAGFAEARFPALYQRRDQANGPVHAQQEERIARTDPSSRMETQLSAASDDLSQNTRHQHTVPIDLTFSPSSSTAGAFPQTSAIRQEPVSSPRQGAPTNRESLAPSSGISPESDKSETLTPSGARVPHPSGNTSVASPNDRINLSAN